jgi:hypothetical protein
MRHYAQAESAGSGSVRPTEPEAASHAEESAKIDLDTNYPSRTHSIYINLILS